MGTALQGHSIQLDYHNEISLPNRRIGLFDRLAIFFRINSAQPPLDLWDCLNPGFLTTPSSIVLRIKDLVIVYASNNYLLSEAFGLGTPRILDGTLTGISGTNLFSRGFGSRNSRINSAMILAQPMRRQHQKEGPAQTSPSLQSNGDGKIYQLKNGTWSRAKNCDFSALPLFDSFTGFLLATLEAVEWILLAKEQDNRRYAPGGFFMISYTALKKDRLELLKALACLGVDLPESDRSSIS